MERRELDSPRAEMAMLDELQREWAEQEASFAEAPTARVSSMRTVGQPGALPPSDFPANRPSPMEEPTLPGMDREEVPDATSGPPGGNPAPTPLPNFCCWWWVLSVSN
eukprot:46374-Heterocapsa_arctica.AAC.1